MTHLIDKDSLVAEIENYKNSVGEDGENCSYIVGKHKGQKMASEHFLSFLDTLEAIDPYEQCIQYASIESGIKAHAEDYSFNIESELFNQLTKEQQALWRKEIEEACISGGYAGYTLAKDPRYEENHEVKEVDLKSNSFDATVCKIGSTYLKEMDKDAIIKALEPYKDGDKVKVIIKAQKGE